MKESIALGAACVMDNLNTDDSISNVKFSITRPHTGSGASR